MCEIVWRYCLTYIGHCSVGVYYVDGLCLPLLTDWDQIRSESIVIIKSKLEIQLIRLIRTKCFCLASFTNIHLYLCVSCVYVYQPVGHKTGVSLDIWFGDSNKLISRKIANCQSNLNVNSNLSPSNRYKARPILKITPPPPTPEGRHRHLKRRWRRSCRNNNRGTLYAKDTDSVVFVWPSDHMIATKVCFYRKRMVFCP